ncbi:hypothetical protein [Protaetiibacter larvae]|uniref:Uncharacterized protein n=1 Tax=Protaetiibacter larvae TaxID=2592654 RepID=A0A5C1Y706_9MICO|nr:hypothetical protein [Protaetiibacter larvae]QEO09586.1 hypothetical protein FLP23_05940 [Protaetiibacter larvae]
MAALKRLVPAMSWCVSERQHLDDLAGLGPNTLTRLGLPLVFLAVMAFVRRGRPAASRLQAELMRID